MPAPCRALQVVSTPWWPPGTEKTAAALPLPGMICVCGRGGGARFLWSNPAIVASAQESVGIISHGFAFMTAMMEVNDTWP